MARRLLASSALLASLVLVSCAAEEPEPTWTEERAYAEAEEVYRAFHEASMEIYGSDVSPDRIRDLVTERMWEREVEGIEWLRENGLVFSGESRIVSFTSTSYERVGESIAIEAEACVDDSDLRITDGDGATTAPRDAGNYVVSIEFMTRDESILISRLEEPSGASC